MKAVYLIFAFLAPLVCRGGSAQACFSDHVQDIDRFEIVGTGNWKDIEGFVYLGATEREIQDFIDLFSLVDPVPAYDQNGDEVFALPSFCCADFIIEVFLKDGSNFRLSLKHGVKDLLFPKNFKYRFSGEIQLTRQSSNSLKQFLTKQLPIRSARTAGRRPRARR